MGIAIIAFSFALRLALTPLTKSYTQSMKKMKEVAPAIEKLKNKYGDDKQGFMKAQSELYRQKGVNPVGGGCVLYIVQIVVLITFFRMFLTIFSADDVIVAFNDLLYGGLKLAQDTSVNLRFLYMDIAQPDVLSVAGVPFPIPGPTIILAAVAQMFSAKMMSPYVEEERKIAKSTPQKNDDFAAAFQSSAIYTFPVLTILAGIRFPSGLALYWLSFSIFQLLQSYKTSGWGGATPWLKALGLIQSSPQKQNGKKRSGKSSK